jgi:hypothetical protein
MAALGWPEVQLGRELGGELEAAEEAGEAVPRALLTVGAEELVESLTSGAREGEEEVGDVDRHLRVEVVLDVDEEHRVAAADEALAEAPELGALAGAAEAREELDALRWRVLDGLGEEAHSSSS